MLIKSLFKCLHKIASLSQKMEIISSNPNISPKSRKNKTLKVLHLASDDFQGGAESVFKNTIELSAKSNQFIIYTASCNQSNQFSQKHIILDDYQNYNKLRGALKYIFNLKNLKILNKALNELKPDIIHTQNYLSRLSPSVLFALKKYKLKNKNIKLIFTQHSFGACANACFYNYAKKDICEECIKKNQIRIAWKNCDRRGRIFSILKAIRTLFYQGIFLKEQNLFDKIIFVSNFQMQKHLQDGYDKNKLIVITNPIESTFYNKNIKLEDKENIIVFFGRISAEKNIKLLIYAFRELIKNDRFSDYKLLIIGDGDEKEKCKNLAKELFKNVKSIDNQYKFLGHLNKNELNNILKQCKINVLPSFLYESFGLSIVESILSGVVPVVSDIGALKETREKYGGFGFRANDKENLYLVLKNVLDDYKENFKKIKNWQNNIKKNANNNNYLSSLIKLYKD